MPYKLPQHAEGWAGARELYTDLLCASLVLEPREGDDHLCFLGVCSTERAALWVPSYRWERLGDLPKACHRQEQVSLATEPGWVRAFRFSPLGHLFGNTLLPG